jgi:hypothetical protein
MNNPTVAAYRAYQRGAAGQHFPPAVIVMTSFLEQSRHQVEAATGISYEVPLITVMTNLRQLSVKPIDSVGVVRRAALSEFVRRQAELAMREKVVVIDEEVSDSPNGSEVKRALRRVRERADAIWILNDDRLLSPRLITDGWLPGLTERPRVPTIVGAASLVSPSGGFGTFAVLPDHTALGAQAASSIYDIRDAGWQLPGDSESQLPLSVTTILDIRQARERLPLRSDVVQHVDRIIE